MPEVAAVLAQADGLIHATPTGMASHPGLPLAEGLLRPRTWVAEVVYLPLDTPLLQAARRRGTPWPAAPRASARPRPDRARKGTMGLLSSLA